MQIKYKNNVEQKTGYLPLLINRGGRVHQMVGLWLRWWCALCVAFGLWSGFSVVCGAEESAAAQSLAAHNMEAHRALWVEELRPTSSEDVAAALQRGDVQQVKSAAASGALMLAGVSSWSARWLPAAFAKMLHGGTAVLQKRIMVSAAAALTVGWGLGVYLRSRSHPLMSASAPSPSVWLSAAPESSGMQQLREEDAASSPLEHQNSPHPRMLPPQREQQEEEMRSEENTRLLPRNKPTRQHINADVRREIKRLKVLYDRLPYEEWKKRISPFITAGALEKTEPLKLLDEVYAHFNTKPRWYPNNPFPPADLALRAQYFFLARTMGLVPSITMVEVGKNINLSAGVVPVLQSRIEGFLKSRHNPQGSQVTLFDQEQRKTHLYRKIEGLRKAYFRLSKKELRGRLKPLMQPGLADNVEPDALMNYLQRNLSSQMLHIFLGSVLKLEHQPARYYSEIYGFKRQSFISIKKNIRSQIVRIRTADLEERAPFDLSVAVMNSVDAELVEELQHLKAAYQDLSREQWQDRMSSYSSAAALISMEPQTLLTDLSYRFDVLPSHSQRGSASPVFRAQYVFLTQIMAFAPSTVAEIAQKLHLSHSSAVFTTRSHIEKFLRSYHNNDPRHETLWEQRQKSGGGLRSSILELKKAYSQMDLETLRHRMQPLMHPGVVATVRHASLLQYMEWLLGAEGLHFFLSDILDLGSFSLEELEAFYGKDRKWFNGTAREDIKRHILGITAQDLTTTLSTDDSGSVEAEGSVAESAYQGFLSLDEAVEPKVSAADLQGAGLSPHSLSQQRTGYADEEIKGKLQSLIHAYQQLPYEQWSQRIGPHLAPEAIGTVDPQSLLQDLYDHFHPYSSQVYSVSPISHELRAQYIFLTRFMDLQPSTLVDLTRLLRYSEKRALLKAQSRVKKFLQNYSVAAQHVSGVAAPAVQAEQRKAQQVKRAHLKKISEQKVAALRQAFFYLSAGDLKSRLKGWVDDHLLAYVNHQNIMNYVEAYFFTERLHIFLGAILNLDKFSASDYAYYYGRREESFEQNKMKIRMLLSELRMEHLVFNSMGLYELLDFTRMAWKQMMAGKITGDVFARFHIDEEAQQRFLADIEKLRKDFAQQRGDIGEFLLLREALGWTQQYHDEGVGWLFHAAPHRVAELKDDAYEKITSAAHDLPRYFASFQDLTAVQQKMLDRLAAEEAQLSVMDHNIGLQPSVAHLDKKLESFLAAHAWHEDSATRALLYASLGIPLVSGEHLAELSGLDGVEVQHRMEHLQQLWQQEQLISTITPRSYEDLLEQFQNLSSQQWQMLERRWRDPEAQEQPPFQEQVEEFIAASLGDDPYKTHIFLSMVLGFEQPSKSLILQIIRSHSSQSVSLIHYAESQKITRIQERKRSIHAAFQNKIKAAEDVREYP